MADFHWGNDRRFRRKILFRHHIIFNFYMNNFETIIENKADFFIIKDKVITFKNVKLNELFVVVLLFH